MAFEEEFKKIYGNSCGIQNWDWNAKRYFDGTDNECYGSETALISSLTSEAYSMYGFEVDYYIKKIDLERDEIMGEDVLAQFVRRFRLKVYSESMPALQKQYSLQGMVYSEIVVVECVIEQFSDSSKIDYNSGMEEWEEELPKIGDLMYFRWCDLYYEVLNVKKFGEGSVFLGSPITYRFNLRVWRNAHEDIESDGMEDLDSYVSLGEVFNMDMKSVGSSGDMLSINSVIDEETEKQVIYRKPKDDVFNGW